MADVNLPSQNITGPEFIKAPVPQNPFYHLESILEAIDGFAAQCLDFAKPELALIEAYRHFFEKIKHFGGTSANFAGLSELLFFRFILKDLEEKLGLRFESREWSDVTGKKSTVTSYFQAGDIILTHDIVLQAITRLASKDKPDVAIFRDNYISYQLLAVFQVKIYGVPHEK